MLAFKALVCLMLLAAAQAHNMKRREAAKPSEVVEVGGPNKPNEPLENHAVKAEHPMVHVDPAVREPVVNAEPQQPAMPALMSQVLGKLPPFVQSIFKDTEKRFEEADAKFNDMLNKQKGKPFFSIMLLKKKNNDAPIEGPIIDNGGAEAPVGHQSIILFKISPKKPEGEAPFNNLHLLGGGGADDVDNKFFEFQKAQKANKDHPQLGGDDLDKMHAQMTGVGEDVNQPAVGPAEPVPLIPQIPFFDFWKQNGKRPYLIPKDERPKTDDDDDSSEEDEQRGEHVWMPPMIIRRKEHEGVSSSEAVKKCMMQHFLRLKASLYYRTVLHMLFVSGILLLAILFFMLSMRMCKRQRAMRMQGMMSVSAIDTKLPMANAPPAYEQLVSEKKQIPEDFSAVKNKPHSTLVNSLAQAYRNRYSVLVNAKPVPAVDSDAVSVSSLPNYEEHTAKASAAKNADV